MALRTPKAAPAESIDKRLGARLKAARLERGFTLDVMGKHIGVRFNTVFKTESGLCKITVERLLDSAKALNRPAADFLRGL